ncbi:CHC2 zinc finger domain-containing protein [Methylicorpusculum oleiharenae]|uniref:CHC2 zinc finger domain-containing protein n=1 Tax=Methylicorpusculum oleiharenae TaxID=1338687 RepID=UPI00135B3EDB|nr:CHC2 zinc finger domain-containing protein [Methylicorpusculum oleiharenae]MCD2451644.1 CHC2 zinc finger domain-containing protein [Methylicorpusculum oleiharenae]
MLPNNRTTSTTTSSNKLDNLLNRLEKVKQIKPGKYKACCPAHQDRSPSLYVTYTDDGKILMKCFGGCDIESIVSSIGLKLCDLMPDNPLNPYEKRKRPPKFSKSEMFDRVVFEAVILSVAVRELLKGETLADDDMERILTAESTINEIAREVR